MIEVCISLAIEVAASHVKLDRPSFDVGGFAIRLSVRFWRTLAYPVKDVQPGGFVVETVKPALWAGYNMENSGLEPLTPTMPL